MLHVDNVSFSYVRGAGPKAGGARAMGDVLNHVTLHVERGALVGILGPNGSGKSTLVRLMAGTLTPASGSVTLDDMPLGRIARRTLAQRIAVVPQETRLTFDYSVLDMVLMGRYPHMGAFELEGPNEIRVAREALAATDTQDLEGRPFASLSGGEKQRVILASALAQSAELLLLDEPTAALDLGYQMEVVAILRQLNRERGITMVLTAHDLNFAAGVCRDLVLLKEGKVIAAGPTIEVLTPAAIRALYGVEADVRHHDGAGHVTVIPIRKAGNGRDDG